MKLVTRFFDTYLLCKRCGTPALFTQALKIHRFPIVSSAAQVKLKERTKPRRRVSKNGSVEIGKKSNTQDAVISCKRPEFNYYRSQTYGKFEKIILASQGWHHKKSKGDYFTINFCEKNPAVSVSEDMQATFEDVGINSDVISVVNSMQITTPTNIQVQGIRTILSGKNTVLAGETGSGKTLAYLLPLIQQVLVWQHLSRDATMNSPLALVLTPSRELAFQIGEVAKQFAGQLPLKTKVLTGGHTKRQMMNPTFEEVDLLIATLGALSKLTTTAIYNMAHVHHVVIDEADTLLDDSFSDKLRVFLRRFQFQYSGPKTLNIAPAGCQMTLVSATMPTSLPEILEEIIAVDSLVKVTTPHLHRVMPHVPQKFLRVGLSHKPGMLLQMVKSDDQTGNPVIIFSNKSATCDWLSLFLNENGVRCLNLNGDMPLEIRMGKFKQYQSGEVNVISCTDIGSRGLDTIRVKHVINYDFPLYMADYIHRCGRTGRVGSTAGCHVTNLVAGQREVELVQKIELAVRQMEALPNVNGNITRVIQARLMKKVNELNMQVGNEKGFQDKPVQNKTL